jgi:hypothetical protein
VVALCRGVDFALSVGDVPAMAKEIPGILRKVMAIVLTFRELMHSTALGNHTHWFDETGVVIMCQGSNYLTCPELLFLACLTLSMTTKVVWKH